MKVLAAVPLSPEWFAARAGRITSTDVPALLGVDTRWKTPLKIYRRISEYLAGSGHGEPPLSPSAEMSWGNRTEEMHRSWYSEVTGRSVSSSPGVLEHPKYSWLAATPDGCVLDQSSHSLPGAWEAKAPSLWTRREWESGVPLGYTIQVTVAMLCLDTNWGAVSAIVQPDLIHRDVQLNEAFVERLIPFLSHWWEAYIIGQREPPAVAADARFLREIFEPQRRTVFLPPDRQDLALLSNEIDVLDQKIALLEADWKDKRAKVQQFLVQQQADELVLGDGSSWRAKTVQVKEKYVRAHKQVRLTHITPEENR